jgi:hypothetical protein
MTVARITEITAESDKSFKDAIERGIKRSTKTLKNVTGAWIQDQEVVVKDDAVVTYRVRMKVTFILNEKD